MNDNSKAETLALELAQELDGELGGSGGVAAAMQDDGKTRDFGAVVSVATALAGLIMSAVQIVMQLQSDKKMAELETLLNAQLPKPDKVSAEQRASVIRKVLRKFGVDNT